MHLAWHEGGKLEARHSNACYERMTEALMTLGSTVLALMRLQVPCCLQMPLGGEGARAPVVHDVVAGPKLTAFITRGAHELPEVARSMLLQR